MESTTTPSADKKPGTERLSLEDIHSDLRMAVTFVEAAAHFANCLYTLASSPSELEAKYFKPDAEHASNMISEIETRISRASESLGAFIDAVPANRLWVEGKSA